MWEPLTDNHLCIVSLIPNPHRFFTVIRKIERMEIQQQEETCIREGAMELAAAANLSSSCGKSRPAGMIEPPRMLPNGIELSIHSCTKSVIREVS